MSDNLALIQLVESQNDKETTINDQAAQLDAALTDLAPIDITGATSPLVLTTADSVRRMVLKLTGTNPGAPFTVEVPTNRKLYVVWNTSGDDAEVTISGGTGVTVGDGELRLVYADGTDVLPIAGGAVESGIDPVKQAVLVVATADGTLASDFAAGAAIDGVVLAENDRILLAGQTAASENGIYLVQASGAPVRADDLDQDEDLVRGLLVPVVEGTAHARTIWMLTTAGPYTIGTTALVFEQIAGGSTTPVGMVRLLDDTATADGVTTDFTLTVEPEGTLLVFIDGLLQDEDEYSVTTTTLSFTTAPPAGAHVIAYDGVFTGAERPYDLSLSVPGVPSSGALLGEVVLPREVDFPDDFAGSELYARTAATAETVLDVEKNGAVVGTITIAATGQIGAFATSGGAVSCSPGDRLAVVNQNPADASLADISITFKGTRP